MTDQNQKLVPQNPQQLHDWAVGAGKHPAAGEIVLVTLRSGGGEPVTYSLTKGQGLALGREILGVSNPAGANE